MKKVLLIIFLILGLASSKAQVVTTEPAIPTDNASVTIYFHADRGNQGLMGFTGTVYAHLGVITDKSTSPTDWKYVKTEWDENIAANTLTRENTNLYSLVIGPSIRDYLEFLLRIRSNRLLLFLEIVMELKQGEAQMVAISLLMFLKQGSTLAFLHHRIT